MTTPGTMSAGRGRGRPRVLTLLLAALLALGLLSVATPAQAHNVLISTSPTDQQTVAETPETVVLTFDQPAVAMGTQIIVTGPGGAAAQLGVPRLVDTTVSQPLQGGAPAGTYTVAWRVTSADGHPVSGTFTFTSRTAGEGTAMPSVSPTPPATTGDVPATTRIVLAALLVLLGVCFTAVVVPRVRRRRRS